MKHEKNVSGPLNIYDQDIQVVEREPWNEHGPVDELIDLQQQIFSLEVDTESQTEKEIAELYEKMAAIERSIENRGEEIAYLYESINIYTEAGLEKKSAAAMCVLARAQCETGRHESGLSIIFKLLNRNKATVSDLLQELGEEPDELLIARNQPPRIEMQGIVGTFLASKHEGFMKQLESLGSKNFANLLRKKEAANLAVDIVPIVSVLHKLLEDHTFPKHLHPEIVAHLDALQDYGPWPHNVCLTLLFTESLSGAYLAAQAQPGLRGKLKRHTAKQARKLARFEPVAGQGFSTLFEPERIQISDNVRHFVETQTNHRLD